MICLTVGCNHVALTNELHCVQCMAIASMSSPFPGPTSTTKAKTMIIKMTDTAPLSIIEQAWPILAQADAHNGQIQCQANSEWAVFVRQHADGRRIVYGWHIAGNGGQYAGFRPAYVGFLVAPGATQDVETVRAIQRVADLIGNPRLGSECIQELPPVNA